MPPMRGKQVTKVCPQVKTSHQKFQHTHALNQQNHHSSVKEAEQTHHWNYNDNWFLDQLIQKIESDEIKHQQDHLRHKLV